MQHWLYAILYETLFEKRGECNLNFPELSRVAVKDGKIIGCIMYSKAKVVDNGHNKVQK